MFSPTLLPCSSRFLRASVTTNRAQSRLLHSLIKKQFAVNNLNLFLPLNEKQKEAAIILNNMWVLLLFK